MLSTCVCSFTRAGLLVWLTAETYLHIKKKYKKKEGTGYCQKVGFSDGGSCGKIKLFVLVLELFHSFFRGSREKLEVKGRKSENENVKIDT